MREADGARQTCVVRRASKEVRRQNHPMLENSPTKAPSNLTVHHLRNSLASSTRPLDKCASILGKDYYAVSAVSLARRAGGKIPCRKISPSEVRGDTQVLLVL